MKKKVVGIDIDEVLRATKNRIIYLYNKDNNKDYENIDYTKYKDMSIEDILDYKDEIIKTEYIDNPIDVYYASRNKITVEEKLETKEDKIFKFLYEDYLVEIYAFCEKTYMNVANDINLLISENYENYDFRIIYKDNILTFSPTLLFLHNLRLYVSSIELYDTYEQVKDRCDIYITADKNYKQYFDKENLFIVGENISRINEIKLK